MGGGEGERPYFCSLSSGVRGQRCWNDPPLLETLLLFLFLTHRVPSWTGVGMTFAGRVSFLQGCGSREAAQAPGSGPTCYTKATLSELSVSLNTLKKEGART